LVDSVVGTACVAFSAIDVLLGRKGVMVELDWTRLRWTELKWTGYEQRSELGAWHHIHGGSRIVNRVST
jgi:hypothetical protein